MRFLADGMLGKLTRWLRMLGQDVEYSTQLDDNQLLEKSKSENRIILTRDFKLYQRAISRGLEAFYVQGTNETERLAELSKRFSLQLKMDMNTSHCPRCNTKLKPIKKEQAKNEVEKNTFLYYEEFWKCLNCGHIYWQGAHWKQIEQTLEQAELKRK